MNILSSFWRKICQPLDGFLWRKDISNPILRPALRNQIMAAGLALLIGVAIFKTFVWMFWFAMGLGCMCWIFWSWARFFTRAPLSGYSSGLLASILLRFFFRLALLAILLYFALVLFRAPVSAILAGLACGAMTALASYAFYLKASGGPRED